MKRLNDDSLDGKRKRGTSELAASSINERIAWDYVPEALEETVVSQLYTTANEILQECKDKQQETALRRLLASSFENVAEKLNKTPIPPYTPTFFFNDSVDTEIQATEDILVPLLVHIGVLEDEIKKTESKLRVEEEFLETLQNTLSLQKARLSKAIRGARSIATRRKAVKSFKETPDYRSVLGDTPEEIDFDPPSTITLDEDLNALLGRLAQQQGRLKECVSGLKPLLELGDEIEEQIGSLHLQP